MKFEVVWLQSAVNDLKRLRKFIEKNNHEAAKKAVALIKNAIEFLSQNPHIGKPVTNLHDFRDIPIRFGAGGYMIRYRMYKDIIHIVHLRHYREEDF